MPEELVFYTNPMSRGRIVRWMLEEVGEPYHTEILEFGAAMKSPEFLAVNPMGKVPTLRHGKVVVTECAAICAYLADAFPAHSLAPGATDAQRGPYYRWLFFGAGPLEAATTNKTLRLEVPEGRQGMAGYGTLAQVLDTLETALTVQDYLVGNRFSAADVYVGSQIVFGLMFGTMDRRPAFEAYVARFNDRPAAVRARAIDDKLIAEKQAAQAAAAQVS